MLKTYDKYVLKCANIRNVLDNVLRLWFFFYRFDAYNEGYLGNKCQAYKMSIVYILFSTRYRWLHYVSDYIRYYLEG